jgi:hypothetical protein
VAGVAASMRWNMTSTSSTMMSCNMRTDTYENAGLASFLYPKPNNINFAYTRVHACAVW